MKIPPLATAVLAGMAVMWAALLAMQHIMPYLPSAWWASVPLTSAAMIPAFVVAAKAYKRTPPIFVTLGDDPDRAREDVP